LETAVAHGNFDVLPVVCRSAQQLILEFVAIVGPVWWVRRQPRDGEPGEKCHLNIGVELEEYQETPSCVTTRSWGGNGALAFAVITSRFSVAGPPPTPL
jgi:hypothetical protein